MYSLMQPSPEETELLKISGELQDGDIVEECQEEDDQTWKISDCCTY